MHICLITPSFPPMVDGGVAIATGRLVEHLRRRGHRLTVMTTAPSTSRDCHQAWSPLPSCFLDTRLPHDPQHEPIAVQQACDWARQQAPFDVILAYFVYPGGYLATVIGEALGVPVVCSCRGNDISKDVFTMPKVVATVLRRCTRLIFVSPSLLRMANTLIPCIAKSTIIANSVDTTLFTPGTSRFHAPNQPVVVGTSGIMRWKKGIDLFLPLIQRLCARHWVRILIAGYALDAEVAQRMTDFLRQYGLQQRVELTGPIPHAQMVHRLQQMDLYVSTSYQEGMPNGILEAMACALPVVATDADGNSLLVDDGVTGYLCSMGDLEALTARCSTLITQVDLQRRMGWAGRQRVMCHFRPEQEAAAVEAVLQQAAAAGRTSQNCPKL